MEAFISEVDMSVKYNLEKQKVNITCMIDGHVRGITTVVNEVGVT